MSLFWHLYLAHLLGDFPFQTNRIFGWKTRNFAGVLIHVSVIVVLSAVLMGPLLAEPAFWGLLAVLGGAHAIQDQLKIVYSKRTGGDGMPLFLLDQAGHLLTTIVAVAAFHPWTQPSLSLSASWGPLGALFASDRLMAVACALVALTYGVDVGRHIALGRKGPLQRDWYGMGERAALVLAGAGTLYTPWAWLFIAAWLVLRLNRWQRLKSQGMLTAVLSLATGWLVPIFGA